MLLTSCLVLLLVKFSLQNVVLSGPGLQPEKIIMPARYFFMNFTSLIESSQPILSENVAVEITGRSKYSSHCRIWTNKLDRKDGTFIVRYKLYEVCYDLTINIFYKNKQIKESPLKFKGPILPDDCHCPEDNYESWLQKYDCPKSYSQINEDLKKFDTVDMSKAIVKIVEKYHRPESTSFCHYVIKNNEIYRDCYGKHVGFNMFSDNILLFLTRRAKLPDMEFVMNLGDWPLVKKSSELLPIFSWCGSVDTNDIVMPTYDITESTLENMGRVTLDTLSVQGSVTTPWLEREPRAFWRGRDSREERLTLIDIAKENPHLFNASLTNFFFFRDKEEQYGPKQPHVSFFKFFDYKYQINIDGTVAAYRLAYLLAGGGLVLRQESPFFEHFYSALQPWEHFVPIQRNLGDLVQRVQWARENDVTARNMAENARRFANEHLLPHHIICYHAVLFWEWSKRLENKVKVLEGMTPVPRKELNCDCNKKHKDEL